jgi:membrane-bound lytic murein transglycosylase D
MRLARGVAGSLVALCALFLINESVVLGQAGPPPSEPAVKKTLSIEEAIKLAETAYAQGVEALSKGELESARRYFDLALEHADSAGIAGQENARFDAYHKDLIDRINSRRPQLTGDRKQETEPRQQSEPGKEVTEPAVIDEVSRLTPQEIAATIHGGVKIFGSYDFDFSIGPPVLQYLEYFVAGRGRSTMQVGLQRSGRYRDLAEKIFKEERVPLDLIWLAQAESVWKPNALSRAAAKGIWQFIPATGLRYGLEQNAWIDDRSHPEKSTRAAARYLRWLYDHFAGDWLLAMAAYNSGEGRVDDAIARTGYADFWELHKRGFLPQETRNYVPIILSIVIISKNQSRYGFDVKPDRPMAYDLFPLPAQTDLKVVADLLAIPYEVVQELNAELRRGVSPPGQYTIKLPRGMRNHFEIAYAALPEDQRVRRVVIPREEIGRARSRYRQQAASYRIRSGDTLHSISRRYGVTVAELARMNRISPSGTLRKGRTLRVPGKMRTKPSPRRVKATGSSKSKARKPSAGITRKRR